jgi:putative addiction module component (TIGR02574 family)
MCDGANDCMSHTETTSQVGDLLARALKLSRDERRRLIDGIWESLDEFEDELPEEHARIIDERLARIEREGFAGQSWEQVKKEILKGQ